MTTPRQQKRSPINRKIFFGLVVLLLITFAALGFVYYNQAFTRPYVAVHLTSGDIYFGQLYHFPRFQLGDVHVVQSMADPNDETQTILQIVPLKLVTPWSPDKLQLNRDQVISISEVEEESQVMDAIRESKTVLQ